MRTSTSSTRFGSTKDVLKEQQRTFITILIVMASAFTALLAQTRGSRSESHTKSPFDNVKEATTTAPATDAYPGSLHRHTRSIPSVDRFQEPQEIHPAPTLRPIAIPLQESMEDWMKEKMSKTSH